MYCRNSTVSSKWCTLVTRTPGSLSPIVSGSYLHTLAEGTGSRRTADATSQFTLLVRCRPRPFKRRYEDGEQPCKLSRRPPPTKSEQTGYRVALLSCQTQKQTSRTTASAFSHHLKRSSQYMISTANSHQNRSSSRKIRITVRWRHPRW